jgi:hypothetical protein
MWAVNAGAVGCAVFFIKLWMNGVKERQRDVREELEKKVDKASCETLHKWAHKHGDEGTAGEVVDL